MKFSRHHIALVAVLLGAAVWLIGHRSNPQPASQAHVANTSGKKLPRAPETHEQQPTAPSPSAAGNNSATISEQRQALSPTLTDAELLARQQKAYDAIEAAAITYDAKSLPLIEPFLTDPDRLVRDAAVQGMIANGDASAASYLRAAAAKTKDPREAAAMLDAADYVELPPASLIRK